MLAEFLTFLGNRINFMMGQKLDDKYQCPPNCAGSLEVPKVNATIWEHISTPVRSRDLRLQVIQKSLVKGICAFAQTFDANTSETHQDALAFFCDANFALNSFRKECIRPDMNPQYHYLCKPTINKVTSFLFGDDLGRQVKDLKAQRKAMEGMMKPKYVP